MPGRTAYMAMKAAARDAGVPQQAGMPVTPDLINKFGIKYKEGSSVGVGLPQNQQPQPVYVNPNDALRNVTSVVTNATKAQGNTYKSGSNFTDPVQQQGGAPATYTYNPNATKRNEMFTPTGVTLSNSYTPTQTSTGARNMYAGMDSTNLVRPNVQKGYSPAYSAEEQTLNANIQAERQRKQQEAIAQLDKKTTAESPAYKKPSLQDLGAIKTGIQTAGTVQPTKGFDIGSVLSTIQGGGTISPNDFSTIMSNPDLANNPIVKMMVEKSLNTESEKQKALSSLESKQAIQDELTRKQREIESFYSGKLQDMSTSEAKDALTRQLAATGGLGSSRNQQMLRDIDTKVQLAKDRQNELNQLSDMITQSNNAAERNNLISEYGKLKLQREQDIYSAIQDQQKLSLDMKIKEIDALKSLQSIISANKPDISYAPEYVSTAAGKVMQLVDGRPTPLIVNGKEVPMPLSSEDISSKGLVTISTADGGFAVYDKINKNILQKYDMDGNLTSGNVNVNPITGNGQQEIYDINKPGVSTALNYDKIFMGSPLNKDGVDLSAKVGTPISSTTNGTVISVGNAGAWGNQVRIKDSEGNIHSYSHLNSIPNLKVGDSISQGQQFAQVGNTGHVLGGNGETLTPEQIAAGRGAHLDYTVYKKDGSVLPVSDAVKYLGIGTQKSRGDLSPDMNVVEQYIIEKSGGDKKKEIVLRSQIAKNGGKVPASWTDDKINNITQAVQKEPMYKEAQESVGGFDTATNGYIQQNGFGDIAMVNGYQRIIDPGATVRGEDVKTQSDAIGFLKKALNWTNQAWSGDMLTKDAREKLLRATVEQYNTKVNRFNNGAYNRLSDRAYELGIPVELAVERFPTYTIDQIRDKASVGIAKNNQSQENSKAIEIPDQLMSKFGGLFTPDNSIQQAQSGSGINSFEDVLKLK